jgi:hypothetical protein
MKYPGIARRKQRFNQALQIGEALVDFRVQSNATVAVETVVGHFEVRILG